MSKKPSLPKPSDESPAAVADPPAKRDRYRELALAEVRIGEFQPGKPLASEVRDMLGKAPPPLHKVFADHREIEAANVVLRTGNPDVKIEFDSTGKLTRLAIEASKPDTHGDFYKEEFPSEKINAVTFLAGKRRDAILPIVAHISRFAKEQNDAHRAAAPLRVLQRAGALGPAEYREMRRLSDLARDAKEMADELNLVAGELTRLLPPNFMAKAQTLARAVEAAGVLANPVLGAEVAKRGAELRDRLSALLKEMQAAVFKAPWAQCCKLASEPIAW